MKNTLKTDHFPGFDYPATVLSKFIAAGDIFTIMLKSGTIIHYTASDKDLFKEWLRKNSIWDLKSDKP